MVNEQSYLYFLILIIILLGAIFILGAVSFLLK